MSAEYQLYQKLLQMDLQESDKNKLLVGRHVKHFCSCNQKANALQLMRDFIIKVRLPSPTIEKELSTETADPAERTKSVNKLSQSVPIRSVPDLPGFDADDALTSPTNTDRKQALDDYMLRTAMVREPASHAFRAL